MRKVAPTIRLFLIGLAGGVLGSVLVLTTRSARAVVGTLDISGSSQTISGDVTAARIVDSANSSYFIDPAAAGTSMSLAGNASVSGSLTVASNQPFRPAFGPVKLDYKSGPDSWATGLIIQDTTGNVGIGTTTPAQKLSVAGTIESTTGGFKFPDGTTQTSAAKNGGRQLFTANGTFTVPAGITTVYVTGSGGGGGGGGKGGYAAGGNGGGGAAAVISQSVTVTPGENISVTIGTGGSGGTSGSGCGSGTAGGTTSFGSYITLGGGGAGTNPCCGGGGAAGGSGGTAGQASGCSNGAPGGAGGSSIFGAGGSSGDYGHTNGSGYGAGGGGTAYNTGGTAGNGSDGFLLVEW